MINICGCPGRVAVKLFFSAAHGFSGVAVRARRIAAARRDLGLAVGALARALAGLGLLGVSGIGRTLAANIVAYRAANGNFRNRRELTIIRNSIHVT